MLCARPLWGRGYQENHGPFPLSVTFFGCSPKSILIGLVYKSTFVYDSLHLKLTIIIFLFCLFLAELHPPEQLADQDHAQDEDGEEDKAEGEKEEGVSKAHEYLLLPPLYISE